MRKKCAKKKRFLNGFHLIELLVALAITSICAGIALPIYNHCIVKAKRLQAVHTLAKLAMHMEEFYLENGTYEGATLEKIDGVANQRGPSAYAFRIENATEFNYVLAADPLGKQARYDKTCQTLKLDSAEKKSISGNGAIEQCFNE